MCTDGAGMQWFCLTLQVFRVFALLCPAAGLRTVLIAGKASQVSTARPTHMQRISLAAVKAKLRF